MTNINIKIPDELHKKLKIACAIEDVTIREEIIKLIEERIKKYDKRKH